MNPFRKYYDAAAGGAGGSALPLSLAELEAGDGNPKPKNLAEEQIKQQQQENKTPIEGVNDDGTLQEGYIKGEDGKVIKDPAFKPVEGTPEKKEPEAGDDENKEEELEEDGFSFADVDKLRGEEIKVEYPEGMDPLSPEGVYHREKAIEEWAVNRFEEHLKKADPRGYAYLLHRQAGGSDDDFFKKKTYSLPEYEHFKENQDVQIKLLKSSLITNGLDEETAQLVVDKAIKDNKVFEKADAAYKAAEASYKKELADMERVTAQQKEAYDKQVSSLNNTLSSAIVGGKGLNLIIPDTEKTPFLNFVRESVQYNEQTGKFMLVQPIESEKVARQLEAMYLQFKNGDLKALIQREAQTANRKRLGNAIAKSKQSGGGQEDKSITPGGFVPLGAL